MAGQSIPVTIVNHLAIDIAASPDALWRTIVESFAESARWREVGYEVDAIDDPSTILSGYRMRLEKDGVVDERICRITERDDAARRLSLLADFVSAPDGVLVYATYQAHETGAGTRYTIDCHTQMGLETPAGGAKADIAAAVATMKAGFDAHLSGYQAKVKSDLEAAA